MASYLQILHLCVELIIITHESFVFSCPTIVSRSKWEAESPTETLQDLKVNPASLVFIHHTAGPDCISSNVCKSLVTGIQEYQMKDLGLPDISYNFLVGGDGAAYEGRGWGKEGEHTPGFNNQSIGIALIGKYCTSSPSPIMLNAAKDLIACGVSQGYISSEYNLYEHRQATDTTPTCSGKMLYDIISTWNMWSPEWIYDTEKCKAMDGTCMDKNAANCTGGHYVSNGECPSPSFVKCCVPCPVAPLDLQFLLDESGSIGSSNFDTMKDFVKDFVESFQIGPDKVQFGVATFSADVRNHFWLNSYTNESSLLQAIDNIEYSSGGTKTYLGLDFIREEAFTAEHGDRPNITNVLFVITDGKSNDPELTVIAAETFHKTTDIVVLAVGVGNAYNEEELTLIAASNTSVFHVSTFIALKYIAGDLRKPFCEVDDLPKDGEFPEWGVVALSVGGSVVVLGAVIGVTATMVIKAKTGVAAITGASVAVA